MFVQSFEISYILANRIDLTPGQRVSLVVRYYIFKWTNKFKSLSQDSSVKFNGLNFYFDTFPIVSSLIKDIFLFGEYRPATIKTDAPTIIDCGGNIGVTSLFLKQKYPNAKIKIFEPAEESCQIIEKSFKANNMKEVEVIRAAVSDTEGEMEFWYDSEKPTSSRKAPLWEEDGAHQIKPAEKHLVRKVPMVKLSSFISGPVDLLKIDIEGGEGLVLKDLNESGKLSQVREIIFEFHPDPKNTSNKLSDILKMMETHGFTVTPTGMSLARWFNNRKYWKPYLIRATKM